MSSLLELIKQRTDQREKCRAECDSIDTKIRKCEEIISTYRERDAYLRAWGEQDRYSLMYDHIMPLQIFVKDRINSEVNLKGKLIASRDEAAIRLDMLSTEVQTLIEKRAGEISPE